MSSDTLILVGCGKMGGAMLRGWLDRGMDPGRVRVVEPNPEAARYFTDKPSLAFHAEAADALSDTVPEAVVFAVKPQQMDAVAPAYRATAQAGAVALSIAAGRTIDSFVRHLGPDAAIVRAMPNTPAAVGRGITVACPNAAVSGGQRALCDGLLSAVGEVAWIADESLMDAVTAVSGSGPAYVFHVVECLAAAGKKAGLPAALSMQLARATVAGSGELMRCSPEDAATLRQNVTSPGGTTEAALKVLMADDGMRPLFDRAVAAATARSRELAG
ncbi:MAG: pyrroline-5-carboxylate reductase [Acetobacterales bacterium]